MLQLSTAQRAPCPCHSSKLGVSYAAPLAFQGFPHKRRGVPVRGRAGRIPIKWIREVFWVATIPKSHPPFSTSMNGKKKRNWFEFLEVLFPHGFGPSHLPTACKRLATWEGWYLLVKPCDKFQWNGAPPKGTRGSTSWTNGLFLAELMVWKYGTLWLFQTPCKLWGIPWASQQTWWLPYAPGKV